MPKVSLILPIYNVEPYIADCLESLVNQTLKDIEIICINDASPDNSWRIVNEYAAKDKRFVLINLPENHGQGNARNQGLDIARGEYIMFVDPDDWLELNACELAYNQIKQNNNDFVQFGISLYYEETKKKVQDTLRLSGLRDYAKQTNVKLDELTKPFLKTGETVYRIYKRQILNQHNICFGEGRMCEDIVFLANFLVYMNDISIINMPLYTYRVRKDSSVTRGINYLDEFWKNKKQGINIILSKAKPTVKKSYIIWHIGSLLWWYHYYSNMNKKIARPFYNEMRKEFTALNKAYDIKELKPYIKYSEFRRIVKYTWLGQKLRRVLKAIYSVRKSNDKSHKIITILGIKLKLNREKQKIAKIKRRYATVLTQLRKQARNRKIKVAFLVNEISKWKYQSLYDLLAKSAEFEPFIAITLGDKQQLRPVEERQKILQKNYDYFTNKNMPCVWAWDINSGAMDIDTDILFYQQPWYLDKKQMPENVSKYALTQYVPYFVPNYGILKMDYGNFHKYLFRYYVLNQGWAEIYKEYAKLYADNVKSAEHTQLDAYLFAHTDENHNYVIYAPHWSICHEKNKQAENYATFLHNGQEILKYAQQHPEINWVFKPHPNLKYALQKIGWSEEEMENYYSEWEKIAKCCYDADYVELFLQSKAMITDCGSFLIEYFVTGKPIIHLISDDCKEVPLEPSKVIFDTFYKAHTLEEMYQHFQDVIIEDNDYMQKQRQDMLAKSGLKGNYAAENIYKDMLQLLNIKK